jgi:predicted  nucleic acid-binding Zn-ribbon protein
MPHATNNSQNQFTSIAAAQDRQLIANETLLANATDDEEINALARASEDIARQMRELADLRHAYAKSHLEPSEAEQELASAAAEIKRFTTRLGSAAKLLNSVAGVARVFTNLFAIFA